MQKAAISNTSVSDVGDEHTDLSEPGFQEIFIFRVILCKNGGKFSNPGRKFWFYSWEKGQYFLPTRAQSHMWFDKGRVADKGVYFESNMKIKMFLFEC